MPLPQGIPEVPMISDWPALRRYLCELRKAVKRLEESVVPPRPVTNLTATPKPGGIWVQFSRSDADYYTLFRNSVKALAGSVRFDLGNTATFADELGAGDETRYYWVQAHKGALVSETIGPVSATSLALDTEAVEPEPPPAYEQPAEVPPEEEPVYPEPPLMEA